MDLALGMLTRFPGLNVQVAGKMLGFTNPNMLITANKVLPVGTQWLHLRACTC